MKPDLEFDCRVRVRATITRYAVVNVRAKGGTDAENKVREMVNNKDASIAWEDPMLDLSAFTSTMSVVREEKTDAAHS